MEATRRPKVRHFSLSLRWAFNLTAALLATYQLWLLIEEYQFTCATLVMVAKPAKLQLPALTICVPIEEVLTSRIAYWNTLPSDEGHVTDFQKAGIALQEYIAACRARGEDSRRWCTLDALALGGFLTPGQVYHFLLYNNSDDYFQLSMTFTLREAHILHTPVVTMSSDPCWTFFMRGGVTFGENITVQGSSRHQLESLQTEVDTFYTLFGEVRYLYAERESASRGRKLFTDHWDWEAIRPLALEIHSPLERGTNQMSQSSVPDESLFITFSYATMDYNDCYSLEEKKCHDYEPFRGQDFASITKDQLVTVKPAAAMSRADCVLNGALEKSGTDLDCLPFGVLRVGFAWWNLQNYTRFRHCDALYGSALKHGRSMLPFWQRLASDPLGPCPSDCITFAYRSDVRAKKQITTSMSKRVFDKASSQVKMIKTPIIMSPEKVPFMRVVRQPSMTGIQFICNAAALLGLWFGWSVSSIMQLKCSHLVTKLMQKLLAKKVRPQPILKMDASEVNLNMSQTFQIFLQPGPRPRI